MKRITIIGISGTGKSHFARLLHEKTGIPVFHMDSIIWNENWQEAPNAEIVTKIRAIEQKDEWIVEGWIDEYSQAILEKSDVILYLDFPGYVAAWGGVKRFFKNKRPEMPEGCIDKPELSFLCAMLFRKERPHIEKLLSSINPQKIIRFRSRTDLKKFSQQA